jgi:hypothetical protein
MKRLQPLPHAVLDYAWAAQMMSAPWLLGFHKNKQATRCAVNCGAAILGLGLLTRYPLGIFKVIPFPVHGVIEALSGAATAAAPWLFGFADDERAKWTHVASGLATLGVVALTDYQAAERPARQPAHQIPEDPLARPGYQVSTASDYDRYSARPPYTNYGDEKDQIEAPRAQGAEAR